MNTINKRATITEVLKESFGWFNWIKRYFTNVYSKVKYCICVIAALLQSLGHMAPIS